LNNIARYRGSAWRPLAHGGLDDRVYALATSGGDLYVGGAFGATADGAVEDLNRIAVYRRGAWEPLSHSGLNGIVRALVAIGPDLYVGGLFTQTADGTVQDLNHIARYDMNTGEWHALANAGLNSAVYALEGIGGDLYAGGAFMRSGDESVSGLNGVARYRNGNWQALAHGGLNNKVFALAASGGDLYAGGRFSRSADGAVGELNSIALYRADKWQPLANGGLNAFVYALEASGEDLYAAGAFRETADGSLANLVSVAHYTMSEGAWHSLAHGGLYRLGYALAISGSDLYVGGYFARTADGEVRSLNNVIRYRDENWLELIHWEFGEEVLAARE
jgi:hypothetical protein